MSIPTLFGCPLWFGKIKRRVAKKYLNRCRIKSFLKKDWYSKYRDLKEGDLINDCTGRNGAITKIEGIYRSVAGGDILIDIDLQTTNTGCSLVNCGVKPALSQELIEKRYMEFMDNWFFAEGGKVWYGGLDNPKYQTEIQLAIKKYDAIKAGGHIVNESGITIPEFDKSDVALTTLIK